MVHIAVCDDEEACLTFLQQSVRNYGAKKGIAMQVTSYSSGEEFIRGYHGVTCDLVFLDVKKGGLNGVAVLKRIWEDGGGRPWYSLADMGNTCGTPLERTRSTTCYTRERNHFPIIKLLVLLLDYS